MLDFKRYYARVRPIVEDNGADPGSYVQHFLDAENDLDAKHRVMLDFGPGWEVVEVAVMPHLEALT